MTFNDRSTDIKGDGGLIQVAPGGMVRFGADSQMNVLFYNKDVFDEALSQQCGRPMKVDKIYVRIQHPGEVDYSDDPVENKPGIKQRFPRQWEQFEKSQEQIPTGTPIDLLFPQHPAIGANLHSHGVHTVEQMANLHEHGAQRIGMGATEWRNAAKTFLDQANAHVGQHQWAREKSVLENTIEVQGNQIGQLQAQLDKLLAQLQGVPGAMIPAGVGPQAQAHAASVVLPSAPRVDWTAGYTVQASPMPAEAMVSSGAEIQQPIKRPRGRPRKVPTLQNQGD